MSMAVETPEIIRQQMDETRSQLSAKLESLELQVAETVQTTGTAVNATVEAVQVTIETATAAVQDAILFINNSCDIRRHVERNPLLVAGASFFLGYLATEYLSRRTKSAMPRCDSAPGPQQAVITGDAGGSAGAQPVAAATHVAAAELRRNDASWGPLMDLAASALVGIVRDVAGQAIPRVLDHLIGGRDKAVPDRYAKDQVEMELDEFTNGLKR